MPESQFDIALSLRERGVTRRDLIQGTAAIVLQAAVPPFAGAEAREQPTMLKDTEATPYSPEVLPAGIRSRFVSGVNGAKMHILEAGFAGKDRPGVVLLHGFPDLAYSWRKVMLPIAAAGFHVLAPDRRGYGRTSGWNVRFDDNLDPFATLNQVRDVLGLAFAFGYSSVAGVIGHDFGSPLPAWCSLVRPAVFAPS